MTNQRWVLQRRPAGSLSADDLVLVSAPMPDLQDGQILVRNRYLSLDPTNRLWMSDREQYLPPVQIGDVMRGVTVGVVEASKSDRFKPGDVVQPADGGWQTYVATDAATTRRIPMQQDIPLTAHLSVLGPTGLTAYFGLLEICRPKAGEIIAVSAAAGAVGSVVGQIARLKGCHVVGIAGGAAKCAWIKDDLGFSAAIDYKSEDVGGALDRLCPEGIDMNFENVGGPIMNALFNRLRDHGRMAICGMIANYNDEGPLPGPDDFGRILMRRLTLQGFVVIDFLHKRKEAAKDLGGWVSEGKLLWKDHVVAGLENAPEAIERLFTGNHDGKLMVEVTGN